MAKEVTERQMDIYSAIKRLYENGNKKPTYREIASEADAEISYVFYAVQSLAKKHMIDVKKGKHRSIRLLK